MSLSFEGDVEVYECQKKTQALKKRIKELEAWINDLQKGTYVTCIYCGHRYGPKKDTLISMSDVLKEHVEQCPKHPMSHLKSSIQKLTAQLTEAQAQCAVMREALGKCQWSDQGLTYKRCPCCNCLEEDGHLTDCLVKKALSLNAGKDLMERVKRLEKALGYSKKAIEEAIYNEDGLDGKNGQTVIRIIDKALKT